MLVQLISVLLSDHISEGTSVIVHLFKIVCDFLTIIIICKDSKTIIFYLNMDILKELYGMCQGLTNPIKL